MYRLLLYYSLLNVFGVIFYPVYLIISVEPYVETHIFPNKIVKRNWMTMSMKALLLDHQKKKGLKFKCGYILIL